MRSWRRCRQCDEHNVNEHAFVTMKNYGQVAQSVERSPEKAGVGGSIPSLATINSNPPVKNFNPTKSYCARGG